MAKPRKKQPTEVKCAWCGKTPVPVKSGRLASHLSPGGVKCVAIGMQVARVLP